MRWLWFHVLRVVVLFYPVALTWGLLSFYPWCLGAEDACIPLIPMFLSIPIVVWITRRFYFRWFARGFERWIGPIPLRRSATTTDDS